MHTDPAQNATPDLKAALAAALAQNEQQRRLISEQENIVKLLTLEIAHLRRMRFGKRSERFVPEQATLFDDNISEDLAEIEHQLEAILKQPHQERPPKSQPKRQALPDHLPREDIVHEPSECQCAQCGGALHKIGEDISEKLHYTPGTFSVQRHIRPKYACRPCQRIVFTPVPASVIEGGLASNELLSSVTIQKFIDHLPLYRIEQIALRQGVHLPRQTLSDWIGRIGFTLQPLVERLRHKLHSHPILHADETTITQLSPDHPGGSKRTYLWAYRTAGSDPPIIIFDYQVNRSGQHPSQFLHGWQGHLMVDDYAGYKALFSQNVTELGCFAHVRRKFYDLYHANKSPVAHAALQRIACLYDIEREAASLTESERLHLRQTKSKPKLDELKAWLLSIPSTAGTGLHKAINYALKRWAALERYIESGAFPIDNNPIESAIRPIAIGRKNWLFIGSERAGKRAAAIMSLLATAKANGIDPYTWLLETLEKLPTCKNSQIDDLLPLR